MQFNSIPHEVVVNPEKKLVIATPEIMEAMPGSIDAFRKVGKAYGEDPWSYLKSLEESVFSFQRRGANIDCSLLPGTGSEMLVMWAPFSDSAPRSSAKEMYNYTQTVDPSFRDKVKAAPNSWNQITKASVVSELLKAVDREMPVLTIFNPLPSVPHNPYDHDDYKQIRHGDYSLANAWIAKAAIRQTQIRLHGPHSETKIDEIHVHGASLGAANAIGMASALPVTARARSVTAQELIVAPKNVSVDLASRFMFRDPVGEKSELVVDEDDRTIVEPFIRRQIDSAGNEPAMFARMLQAISKVSRLKGLTRPERNLTPRLIERLAERGIPVMLPLAENSGLTHDTPKYLPHAGETVVKVRAVEGQRTAHSINEQVALTALLAVLNVKRSESQV